MSRATALESSLGLAASGAVLALAVEVPSIGSSLQLAGWLLLLIGAWSFVLVLLVGTSATTAIGTTRLDREPQYRREHVAVARPSRSTQ
jgi:hypothetical protein